MCGITGYIDFTKQTATDSLYTTVRRMADTLVHRGPDDDGAWVDEAAGVALGHRRLAIVDLSPEGHQPMVSASGRYVMVFNGEIYNFKAIRAEIDSASSRTAVSWRGHSDTEVMLAAIDRWGLETSVEKFVGMFAFALWDRQERLLHLVRDRLGEKPLYYGWQGKSVIFGSELKVLKTHPDFRADINRNALALYMRHNCIPAPYSIYRDVYKLVPGTILTINGNRLPSQRPEPVPYWQASEVAVRGVAEPFTGCDTDAIDQLDILLREAVGLQMVADVPLGAFLSGGIDSSTIVALMQAQSNTAVKTFTIGFSEMQFNEAPFAAAVANHLGTDHTELYVTPRQTLDVIPKLATLYDEPFSDSSQIPTYLLSALTRSAVTVSLSGDGGDELFAGYNRHYWGSGIWDKIHLFPLNAREFLAEMLKSLAPQKWDSIYLNAAKFLPARFQHRLPGDKIHKFADILTATTPEDLYYNLVSHWKDPAEVVKDAVEPSTIITAHRQQSKLDNFSLKMMLLDLLSYLPDDILAKVDRAGMGVSLETRMPFLDHRLVEFAWQLPLGMKLRNGQGKWLLRQVLNKYVPKELIERPKMGFGIPIDNWLRGPLRDWAEELLDEHRLHREGYFHPEPVRARWNEHLSGKRNWEYPLWDVLMFQAWLERQSA